MAPTVYFIRHGQTAWNAEGRLQGQADTDLNEIGRAQATRNGEHLAELISDPASFDFVASPMRRARETMARIRMAMGLDPAAHRLDERLVEVHFGDWGGYTFAELEQADPGCFSRRERDKWHFVPPGAVSESYQALTDRVRPWFESIDRNTVCVTHGGVLRAVFRLTDSLPPAECAALEIPQDRLLRLRDGRLEWL